MKFSTSALLAVALASTPFAHADCPLQTLTSIQGGKDAFGFCEDYLVGLGTSRAELTTSGTHWPFNNNFDNNPNDEPEMCSAGEGFPYDQSLEVDVTLHHEIDIAAFSECTAVRICTTVLTAAQGFDGPTSITVEGQNLGDLTDGDDEDINPITGEVTVQKDTKCIEQMKVDGATLGDGVQVVIDTYVNPAFDPLNPDAGGDDRWSIDYSEVVISWDCPCSETAPDPHFKTFGGDWFDFHGGCDLVLIDVPDYDNQAGLVVNIRTTVRYAYSFIETLAIMVGEDILQVSSWGDYILNGISNADLEGATLNGLPVTREVISDRQFKFVVNLANGHHFTIKVFKDMISTSFDLPEEHDVRGILGDRSGAKLARDGVTIIGDANEFGQEWQVQDTDHQLFQTVREPQFPAKCIMPDPVEREKRRLSATVSQEAAEAACSHIKDEHVRDMCIFDVISVDDLSLAAGAY